MIRYADALVNTKTSNDDALASSEHYHVCCDMLLVMTMLWPVASIIMYVVCEI
jgi:hypothetical protein